MSKSKIDTVMSQPSPVGVPIVHPQPGGVTKPCSDTRTGQTEALAVQAINSFKPDLQWLPIFLLL